MPNVAEGLTDDAGRPLSFTDDVNSDAGFDEALRAATAKEPVRATAEKPTAVDPSREGGDEILAGLGSVEASNRISDGLTIAEKQNVITREEWQLIEQAEKAGAKLIADDAANAAIQQTKDETLALYAFDAATRNGADLVASLADLRASVSEETFDQVAYRLAAERAGVDPSEWSQLDDYEAQQEADALAEEFAAINDAVDFVQGQRAYEDAAQTSQRMSLEAEVARGEQLENHYRSLGAKSQEEIVTHWERDVRHAAAYGVDLRAVVASADPRSVADLVQSVREHRGQIAADMEADRIRASVLDAESREVSDGLEGWTAYGYQKMSPRHSVEVNRSAEELQAIIDRRVQARAAAPKTVGEFRQAILDADTSRDVRDGFTVGGKKVKVSEIDGSAEEARRRALDDRAADRHAGVRIA